MFVFIFGNSVVFSKELLRWHSLNCFHELCFGMLGVHRFYMQPRDRCEEPSRISNLNRESAAAKSSQREKGLNGQIQNLLHSGTKNLVWGRLFTSEFCRSEQQ